MSQGSDIVSLALPGGERWTYVAELVLAGLGARLDLPYDRIDELQLAVASVLREAPDAEVRVEARADPGALELTVGPLTEGVVDDPARRRVLDALADAVSVVQGAGGPHLVLTFARGGTG